MALFDAQTSFAGGEIAPELWGRTDLSKYKSSARTLRNMIPTPRGPATTRPGTYFIAKAKNASKKCRLISFTPSATDAYVLEFGDLYVRFYKSGGQIQSGGFPYEISTPYTETELAALRFARSADTLYIVHPNHQPRTLQRFADANWTLALYAFEDGPFMLPNSDAGKKMSYGFDGGGTGRFISTNFDFFQSTHVGALIQVTQIVDAQLLSGSRTSTGVFTYTADIPAGVIVAQGQTISYITCGGGWRFRTHGTWVGKIVIQKSNDLVTWSNIQYFVSNGDANFDTFGTEDISLNDGNPIYIRVNCIAYTSGTIMVDLSANSYELYTTLHLVTYVNARKMYVNANDSQFATTSLWAEGSWSDYRGWPSAVTFFQDRLAFGGAVTEPQTVWFTKTSNYVSFRRSIPLVDSDGITVSLQNRQVNPVVNMVGAMNTCVIFTGYSYWSIGSSSGGSITPTTVFSKVQEQRGANGVDPIVIGNRLIFIEGRGATVRDIEYQYLTDRYQSENVSLLSDHLFRGYTIIEGAYQQTPDSLLWLVRSDGAFLSCTYLREQEVLAWARHDTNGTVESVCSIPGSGYDEVWFIVQRNSMRFIERMIPKTTSTDPLDQYCVDAGIAYSGGATATVSGYDHLNGLTVSILANGLVATPQTVSSGNVIVPAGTTRAAIGLGFTCDLETLNPDTQLPDGAMQGRRYQINRAGVRLLNSGSGKMGADLSSLDPQNLRSKYYPTLTATDPTPLFTDFDYIPIRPSNDPRDHIAYRMSDPLPATILAVLPIVNPGQLP